MLMVQVHKWSVMDSVELSAKYIPENRDVLADKLIHQG